MAEHEIASVLATIKEADGSRSRHLLRHPRVLIALAAGIRGLPRTVATPSERPGGRFLRTALPRRRLLLGSYGHRAILEVPERSEEYSLGADKQTLRRKARKAARLSVTWRALEDATERESVLRIAEAWAASTGEHSLEEEDNEDLRLYDHWLAAFSSSGAPVLLAVTPVDGEWAVLRYFRSIGSGPEQSDTRYLMMQVLVEDLARRGVRHLVDPIPPLDLPAGLQHFQRMVGFRLRRARASGRP